MKEEGWNYVFFLINDVHWFKVALRIRPLNDAEIEEGATTVAHKIDSQVRENKQQTKKTLRHNTGCITDDSFMK